MGVRMSGRVNKSLNTERIQRSELAAESVIDTIYCFVQRTCVNKYSLGLL